MDWQLLPAVMYVGSMPGCVGPCSAPDTALSHAPLHGHTTCLGIGVQSQTGGATWPPAPILQEEV